MIVAINHQRAIRIKFHNYSIQSLKKLAIVKRLFRQLGTHSSGHCCCREVAIVRRFKQETAHRYKKSGRCRGHQWRFKCTCSIKSPTQIIKKLSLFFSNKILLVLDVTGHCVLSNPTRPEFGVNLARPNDCLFGSRRTSKDRPPCCYHDLSIPNLTTLETHHNLALKNLQLLQFHLTEGNFAQFAKHREK